MAQLHFTDTRGREGEISESLEVEYDGQWRQEVAAELRRIAAEAQQDDPEDPPTDVYTRIVLELPDEAPVKEVERTDNPLTPGPVTR